jgi:hypothetical protein
MPRISAPSGAQRASRISLFIDYFANVYGDPECVVAWRTTRRVTPPNIWRIGCECNYKWARAWVKGRGLSPHIATFKDLRLKWLFGVVTPWCLVIQVICQRMNTVFALSRGELSAKRRLATSFFADFRPPDSVGPARPGPRAYARSLGAAGSAPGRGGRGSPSPPAYQRQSPAARQRRPGRPAGAS